MGSMSNWQRFSIVVMAFIAIVMIALLVHMAVTDDYRLWAVELVLLCAFAVVLRTYAREWRKLRDKREANR